MIGRGARVARWCSLLAAAVVSAVAGSAGAAVIYDNLGSGDGFGSSSYGFNVVARDGAVSFEVESSDAPFLLDSIDVALQGSGNGEGVLVHLASDDAGQPGPILETSSVFIFGTPSVRTASFSGTTSVDTPGTYWVWLELSSGSNFNWFHNDQGATGSYLTSEDGGSTWDPLSSPAVEPALRVNGVPEPSTFALLALGMVGLAARSRGGGHR